MVLDLEETRMAVKAWRWGAQKPLAAGYLVGAEDLAHHGHIHSHFLPRPVRNN